MACKQLWIGALLLPLMAVAAEPAQPAQSVVPGNPEAPIPASPNLAQTFDLRSSAVREVVRATASTQASADVRFEPVKRDKPDLAEALRVERPAKRREAAPRLPDRPPPCDGFFSCGLETLLGHNDNDFDDEQYARQQKNVLMNQGSFTDKSNCDACQSQAPPALSRTSGASTELRPDQP